MRHTTAATGTHTQLPDDLTKRGRTAVDGGLDVLVGNRFADTDDHGHKLDENRNHCQYGLITNPQRDATLSAGHTTFMRKIMVLWHRYVTWVLMPLLTVVALTGILVTWNEPLERRFAPALFAPLPPRALSRLDPFTLRDQALRAFPSARIDGVDLRRRKDAPTRFYLSIARGATPLAVDEVGLDPYTGKVLGGRRYGDLSQGLINLMPFVYRLHDSLAMGSVGATLLGIAALLWAIDCCVGAALTFPACAEVRRSPPAWLRRWREAWQLRRRAGSWRRTFDLHRTAGLWPWGLMLAVALSGVAFNLPSAYQTVVRPLAGYDSPYQRSVAKSASDQPPVLDLRAGYVAVQRALATEAAHKRFTLRSEILIFYDASKRAYAYRANTSRGPGRLGDVVAYVDADSGSPLAFAYSRGDSLGSKTTAWLKNLHTAGVFEGPMRIMLTLIGLAIIALNITGAMIYLRKRRARAALV